MRTKWPVVQLGKVCTFENGDRGENYPGRSAFIETGIPIINAGHLLNNGIDTSKMNFIARERFELLRSGNIRRGDVLFCLRGSLGKFGLNDCYDEGAIASSLIIIRPKSNLDVRFFCAYLDSSLCADMIRKFANGAAQPNLGGKSLEKFTIPLPPLEEQRRIVAVLDEAFAAIAAATANAEKNLANAREILLNTIDRELEGSGLGWIETTMEAICSRFEYGTSAKSRPTGNVPVLRMGNLQNGEIDWSDLVFTDDPEDIRQLSLRPMDVLFNRTNSLEHVGKTAIVRDDRPAIFAGYLIRLHYRQEVIDPQFLNIHLNSRSIRAHGRALAGKSVNQANISAGKLKTYPINLPPVSVQKNIVSIIDELRENLERLQIVQKAKIDRLAVLKESLLHRAFTGKLTATMPETLAA